MLGVRGGQQVQQQHVVNTFFATLRKSQEEVMLKQTDSDMKKLSIEKEIVQHALQEANAPAEQQQQEQLRWLSNYRRHLNGHASLVYTQEEVRNM